MKSIKSYIPHFIFAGLLFIFVVIIFVRLIEWNTRADELPGKEVTPEVLLQADDFTAYKTLPEDAASNDGITNILFLGDGSLSPHADGTDIPTQVAELTGANVYNCSFPNSTVTATTNSFSSEAPIDGLSLALLTIRICNQDFTPTKDNLEHLGVPEDTYIDSFTNLLTVDYDKIDIVVINYGPSDYINGQPQMDPNDNFNPNTYSGALSVSIANLMAYYPHLQIITNSPTYCVGTDKDGNTIDGAILDTGYGKLPDYMEIGKNVSIASSTCFLDNLYGLPINYTNYQDYLDNDMLPNATARNMIAQRIATMVTSIMPTNSEIVD